MIGMEYAKFGALETLMNLVMRNSLNLTKILVFLVVRVKRNPQLPNFLFYAYWFRRALVLWSSRNSFEQTAQLNMDFFSVGIMLCQFNRFQLSTSPILMTLQLKSDLTEIWVNILTLDAIRGYGYMHYYDQLCKVKNDCDNVAHSTSPHRFLTYIFEISCTSSYKSYAY